jgi:hypothetical protein
MVPQESLRLRSVSTRFPDKAKKRLDFFCAGKDFPHIADSGKASRKHSF